MIKAVLLLLALALPSAVHAAEASAAKVWLERMQHALNQANFQLSLVQMQREQIRTLRYAHGVVDEQQVAFLEHLNGPHKSAIRIGDTVVFVEHDVQPYSVRSDRIPGLYPGAFAGDLSLLEPHYRFVEGGRNRVAGRTAQLIRIVSADQYRYQYRIWLDVETAIPLRVDLVNSDNDLLEQLLVVEAHVMEQPLPLLAELQQRRWPDVVQAPGQQHPLRWRFGWLPQGFEVVHHDQHMLIGLNEPVEYLSVSDGLSEFSVYIGLVGRVPVPSHITTNNGLALASATHGEVEVVVVGKMPVEALANVADNVYPAK
ncbi:MucB/RseB C-terminal domain-containing protein [Ferrimonas marina]|uniref:Sigma E regulatory protein, MucB/RseB n=1 Tax=Ferrimonas marina TaxID=299255 RepID=A0A1M5ZGL9_9GAMM|nr:MucB/RseB C-terminal domain-containing protein [Ferrimonas marina]SHI23281.1 sigma E regulatory protein, MucB/RseB [Ferrimonas marina]